MIEHDQFLYPWGTPCLTQADVQLKHLQEITIGVSCIFSILLWAWEPQNSRWISSSGKCSDVIDSNTGQALWAYWRPATGLDDSSIFSWLKKLPTLQFLRRKENTTYIYDLIIFDKGEREASEQEWKPLCIVCLIKMSLRKPCKKKATYVSNPSQSFQPIFDIDQYFGLPKQGVPQNELVYRIFPIEIAIFGCTVLHLQSYP